MKNEKKEELFEQYPIPTAVATLAIPTVLSSLVMVLYNLADTYFVGMLNDPIQNAGVALAAPVLLAFNAVNNLFGVGSSSMMSRALGRKEYDVVYQSSAFGFYSAVFFGFLMALFCTIFSAPLLNLLGADEQTAQATSEYMFWTVTCSGYSQCGHGVFGSLGGFGASCQYWNHERLFLEHDSGSHFYPAVGTEYGSRGRWTGYFFVQLCRLCILFCLIICEEEIHLRVYFTEKVYSEEKDCGGSLCCGNSGVHSESAQCDGLHHFE